MTQALAKVTPTDFSQPAPLQSLTDQLANEQRGGINPGLASVADTVPVGGPYVVGPVQPNAVAPPTTIAPLPSSGSTTTSTTLFP
jgi:hypothetical protein